MSEIEGKRGREREKEIHRHTVIKGGEIDGNTANTVSKEAKAKKERVRTERIKRRKRDGQAESGKDQGETNYSYA